MLFVFVYVLFVVGLFFIFCCVFVFCCFCFFCFPLSFFFLGGGVVLFFGLFCLLFLWAGGG